MADSFEEVVKTECSRIIQDYTNICIKNNDTAFMEGLKHLDKTEESCINHIMNNLTEKRIYGGPDSLMYEYIHEYYVDKFTNVEDKWSKYMNAGNGGGKTKTAKVKDDSEEEKPEIAVDVEAIKKQAVADYKLELKRKEVETMKKKEAEAKAKEEAKKKALEESKKSQPQQMSLFDL